MIMLQPESDNASMKHSSPQSSQQDRDRGQVLSEETSGRLLKQRLELVEDLWQTVLRSECPPEQAERLLRLKKISDPICLEE